MRKSSYVGGILTDSIPQFKLPQFVVDYEINLVRDMGVEINLNQQVGEDIGYPELFDRGFAAILLTVGVQEPNMLCIDGEDLEGVYSGKELLKAANGLETERAVEIGKDVIVIGGGSASINVACSTRCVWAPKR